MNKDNLPQFSKDIFKIWEVALLKGRPLYGTDMKKKPQISKKEINKMLDKCQSAGAMRILKKIFLKKI